MRRNTREGGEPARPGETDPGTHAAAAQAAQPRSPATRKYIPYCLFNSVADPDPGSGAFLIPGSRDPE